MTRSLACLRGALSLVFAIAVAPSYGAIAQTRVVVPATAGDTEQASFHAAPGIGFDGRVQFIIDEGALTSARGRNLLAIEFRRDTSRTTDLGAASVLGSVRVGASLVAAHEAMADFASNAPNTSLAFQGMIQVSASSVTGYAGWVAPHVLRIDFQTPYAYASGALAIEIDASTSPEAWWPVDCASDSAHGNATRLGSTCSSAGYLGSSGPQSLDVDERELVAGSTVRFTQSTALASSALGLLALEPLPIPMDLGVIGAPGCQLHVLPITGFAPTMSHGSAVFGGTHVFHLSIPPITSLLAARFVWQSIELDGLQLSATEALDCTLSASVPGLGIAMLEARMGGAAAVRFHHVPVLGIVHD